MTRCVATYRYLSIQSQLRYPDLKRTLKISAQQDLAELQTPISRSHV